MKRSALSWAAAAVGLGLLGIILGSLWEERRLPHYEGRSVRSWFLQLARSEAARHDDAARCEAMRALLELGTNALPFLLGEAMTFRRDTPLRTNLFRAFADLPPFLGGGGFVPYSQRNQSATFALRCLRPPAAWLENQLRPHLAHPDSMAFTQALFLFGCTPDAAPGQISLLVDALTGPDPDRTNRWHSAIAAQSISWLGPSASNALPAVLKSLEANPGRLNLLTWIARLGPAATSAIPVLESALQHTNAAAGLRAAVALECVSPGHKEARRRIEEALIAPTSEDPRAPSRLRPASEVLHLLRTVAHPPNPYLADLIAPRAEAEASAWSSAGGSYAACGVLERLDPSRAASLYRARFDSPGAALTAAGSLLRLQRTHADATALLMKAARSSGADQLMALWWLREGSSSNPGLTNLLSSLATDPGIPEASRANARESLARLRYREARVAHGLPEGEW